MGQFLGENIPYLVKDSGTQISLPATYLGQPTRLVLGGQGYKLNAALVCNLSSGGLDTGSLAANSLYYVYAVISGGNVVLEASLNAPSVGPVGFTQWRQIGRFRTLVGSAAVADVVNNVSGNGGRDESQMVSEWQSYSATVTVSPISGYSASGSPSAQYRRVGSTCEIRIAWRKDGNAGTGASELYFTLPSGLTINTAVAGTTYNNYQTPGYYEYYNGGTVATAPLQWSGSLDNKIAFQKVGATTTLVGTDIAAGSKIEVFASVPIAEWANLFS